MVPVRGLSPNPVSPLTAAHLPHREISSRFGVQSPCILPPVGSSIQPAIELRYTEVSSLFLRGNHDPENAARCSPLITGGQLRIRRQMIPVR
jgi:hypothetical protein